MNRYPAKIACAALVQSSCAKSRAYIRCLQPVAQPALVKPPTRAPLLNKLTPNMRNHRWLMVSNAPLEVAVRSGACQSSPPRKKPATRYNCHHIFASGAKRLCPWGDRAGSTRYVHRGCIIGGWDAAYELLPATTADTEAVVAEKEAIQGEINQANSAPLQQAHPAVELPLDQSANEPPPVGHGPIGLTPLAGTTLLRSQVPPMYRSPRSMPLLSQLFNINLCALSYRP